MEDVCEEDGVGQVGEIDANCAIGNAVYDSTVAEMDGLRRGELVIGLK